MTSAAQREVFHGFPAKRVEIQGRFRTYAYPSLSMEEERSERRRRSRERDPRQLAIDFSAALLEGRIDKKIFPVLRHARGG